jgi:hypothetical protein
MKAAGSLVNGVGTVKIPCSLHRDLVKNSAGETRLSKTICCNLRDSSHVYTRKTTRGIGSHYSNQDPTVASYPFLFDVRFPLQNHTSNPSLFSSLFDCRANSGQTSTICSSKRSGLVHQRSGFAICALNSLWCRAAWLVMLGCYVMVLRCRF